MGKSLHQYGDLLNVADLAEYMGVSKRTVYRLTNSGELPCVQVGHRLYYPKRKLAALFEVEAANA